MPVPGEVETVECPKETQSRDDQQRSEEKVVNGSLGRSAKTKEDIAKDEANDVGSNSVPWLNVEEITKRRGG